VDQIDALSHSRLYEQSHLARIEEGALDGTTPEPPRRKSGDSPIGAPRHDLDPLTELTSGGECGCVRVALGEDEQVNGVAPSELPELVPAPDLVPSLERSGRRDATNRTRIS